MKTKEVDVLVIGTGAVGATYARCLGGWGRQVTMIDAGPQLRSRPGRHLLNTFRYQHEPNLSLDEMMANHEVFSVPASYRPRQLPKGIYAPDLKRLNYENPQQNPDQNMPFAGAMYAVGGMFSFWSGFAPIPVAAERVPLIPANEWTTILRSGLKLLNVHTDAFEPSRLNAIVRGTLSTAERPVRNAPMGAQKRSIAGAIDGAPNYYVDWTGSDTILGDLIAPDNRVADNLEILEQHRAEEILHDGSVVTGVRVRNLASLELIEFRAREVCVACGTFLSAMLLWKSNIRPPALGKFIGDNPVVTGMVGFGPQVIEQLRADASNPARNEPVPIAWTEPSPKCQIEPAADTPWLIHLSRTGRTQYYPQIEYDVRLSLDITGYSTVESRPENRLDFSDRITDRFGMPQMTIHYSMTDHDKKIHEALRQDILELGNRLGGFYRQPTCQEPGTSLHYTGVTRMGTDRSESVVDPFCRVHDFENLHIGGGGVLPESIASNPTLTCCAIAFRSAAAILGVSAQTLADRICPDAHYAQDAGIPVHLVE